MVAVTRPAPTVSAPLVLASASPRRRELLTALGARFEVRPADVDETLAQGEDPVAAAERLAAAKAEVVAAVRPEARVLAADTVVIESGEALGKPRDDAETRRFLRRLSGVPHRVVTAHVLRAPEGVAAARVETQVRLRALTGAEIERWVESGAGLDKAGGYAIQDVGAALVDEVHGCYSNVVGLSLPAVLALAAQLGVELV
jgi:septum formation protein